MRFTATELSGAYIIEPAAHRDERGSFTRTFCKREFAAIGHTQEFVQFNHSVNYTKGTIRGMHFHIPPVREIKLIRCIRGKIYDVIIDLRKQSPTFLKYTAVELSQENMRAIYVPVGFAHGFQSLVDNSELLYHHTDFHTPTAERGIRYDDPLIGIAWPQAAGAISAKDTSYALLDPSYAGIDV